LVRLPRAQLVPPFTDETEEVLRALAIARGESLPLTNVDAYIGAMWSYVLAAAFRLFGESHAVPRWVAIGAGSATVAFTFLLGRRIFGTTAGLVAAALLAANGMHTLVNSHVAWSNCASPLFTTAGLWLLARGSLPGSALVLGLALQTHPSVATILPGAAAFAIWRQPRLFARRSTWLAVLLFGVGYGMVIAYNIGTGFDSLVQARRVSGEYFEGGGLDAFGYASSVAGFWALLGQVIAGAVAPHEHVGPYVSNPAYLPSLLIGVVAVGWGWYARQPLPAFIVLSVALLLPVLNQRWMPNLQARYLMPVTPLVLVAIGGLAVHLLANRGRWGVASVWIAVAASAAVHQVQLHAHYAEEIASGRSNAGVLDMVALVEANRRDREPFVVHADLHQLPTGGGGTWAKALDYVLQLDGVRRDVSPRDPRVTIRSCDVESVELRYVQRESRPGARPDPDEPRHPSYWIARQLPLAGGRAPREVIGSVIVEEPYTLPYRPKSLFDKRLPTFDTGCE
jgi:hypothetical protein